MDCNLGCYYCYEERSGHALKSTDVAAIVDLAKRFVTGSGRHSLHVDWYGGEPLLNLEFLEAASLELQEYCEREGVSYVASIISNGTLWPGDVEAFVARNRIRQVQISFDGLQTNHDKRRRYRRDHDNACDSSFAEAVNLVDRLVRCVRVDLRFNIDRANSGDLVPFIRFAKDRGWFNAVFPAVFQPARLASYSEASDFMRKYELSLDEFDALRAIVRNEIGTGARIEESEIPDGFPRPKTSVCAALAANSLVVGADGLTYRCGLQAGETKRAVGTLEDRSHVTAAWNDQSWWEAFDPTSAPSCSKCSFLPICWGGCPKKHLEGDVHAIQEQGRYWRNNLLRLIAHTAGIEAPRETVVADALQFR
nr:radical SAM protein [Candidatus Rhodoblastus alkanivorans]